MTLLFVASSKESLVGANSPTFQRPRLDLQARIEKWQRVRKERAARLLMPLALVDFTDYTMASMPQLDQLESEAAAPRAPFADAVDGAEIWQHSKWKTKRRCSAAHDDLVQVVSAAPHLAYPPWRIFRPRRACRGLIFFFQPRSNLLLHMMF
jgi:hypothetical protein